MICSRAAKAAIGLSIVTFSVVPEAAKANVFDTYGQSAGTIAIGNATTAGGTSAFAAYTNPALLVHSKKNEISGQAILTRFDLADLPQDTSSTISPSRDRASDADDLQGNSVGMNFVLREGLNLGIAAYVPSGSFGRIKGLSSYQSSYLRYSENQEKPAIYSALAVELPYGFSIGVGAYYSLRAKGVLQIGLTNEESEGRVDLNMEPVVAPYGGIAWRDAELGTTVGVYYREAQKTDSQIDASLVFSTDSFGVPFNASTSIVPFYDPAIFRFGVSQKIAQYEILFSFEQAQWARYKDAVLFLTGNDVASISAETPVTRVNLRDTQAYRLGFIAPFTAPYEQTMELRLGLESHTSANRPGKRGNVIDPARNAVAAGLVWKLKADEKDRRLSIEVAGQYNRLSETNRVSTRGTPISVDAGHSITTFVGGLNYEL
ncbi:MAG: hypothetical protein EOP10_06345 [Proteobacteria bacterium]|nr:MAG: hypothetical protein EOP10_06345 [Pseudomonadota bacterium]